MIQVISQNIGTNGPSIPLRKTDELGYQGYLGLEYLPLLPSEESLARMRKLLAGVS